MSKTGSMKRMHSPELKAKIVLELVRGDVTLSEASRRYEVGESLLSQWKKDFIERSPMVFARGAGTPEVDQRLHDLEQMFKEQSLELAILKKALNVSASRKGRSS